MTRASQRSTRDSVLILGLPFTVIFVPFVPWWSVPPDGFIEDAVMPVLLGNEPFAHPAVERRRFSVHLEFEAHSLANGSALSGRRRRGQLVATYWCRPAQAAG